MAWGPLGGGHLFRDDTARAILLRKELGQIGDALGVTMDQVALAWLLKHPAKIIPKECTIYAIMMPKILPSSS